MITKDLGFTQGQLEMFAQENNDIYFWALMDWEVCEEHGLVCLLVGDVEESFYW